PASPALTAFVYSGAPLSDAGFQLVVSQAATTNASTTTLTSSAPTRAFGDAVTFTATVASSNGSGATPTGTVAFSQDGVALGSSAIQPDGTATLTRSNLPVGTDHITATYGGDTNYTGSASAALTQSITPPANAVLTTTTLASSAPSAVSGTAVVLTATITPATPGAAPTGTVSFAQGATVLGTAPVQSDGTAALTTSSLTVGADLIIATYTGDNAYGISASSPFTQTITAPLTLAPTITKSTLPAAIVSGAAAHGSATVSIANQTAATIKGKTTLAIFASTTGAIDGSSILLGQTPKTLNVTTAKPTSASVNLKIAAAALPAGHYTLFARVTDANGNASDSPAGPTLDVAAPFIALAETLASSSLPTTATANSKSHGSAILAVTNSGNITTAATSTLALFATANGTIDGTSLQLTTVTQPLKIKPGKPARAGIPLKQIPAIPPGSYTIVAQITDPDGALSSVLVGSLTITA
ncbi:MAG TPA: Ig-like domain-containing protein, partial [Tepidisphaeraceae bacterium]